MLTLCQNIFQYNNVKLYKGGGNMPKGSPELTEARREEIINACEKLYQTMSFKEITLRDIAGATSFTRTSIYNYFQTKGEIFLALLTREYNRWIDELSSILAHEKMSREEFAEALARSLENRSQLIKIMSMNHYDMEENSRPENLVEMKIAYGRAMSAVRDCIKKFFPEMTTKQVDDFIYNFFPFMFGIYPYTFVTEKQRAAMEKAGVNYVFLTIYEITYNCVIGLLKS